MRDKPDVQDVAVQIPEATDLCEIGEGGHKVVYRAQVGDTVEAVKLALIPSDDQDEDVRDENVRRIRRELAILRECESPFLVKLGSIEPRECNIGGRDYVIYSEEYVPGESVRALIHSGHCPATAELASLGRCLLLAVRELADRNLIHRDIKPDNVIRSDQEDRPFILLDLGIAYHVGGTPLTRDTRGILGTLYYIAPEMLDAGFRQNLDHRADLYTVGLTLCEFGSGVQPFARQGDPEYTTLYRIKTQNPRPLRELRPDLPVEFCRLVDQLMKKLPALRPSNMPGLIRRMEGLL